MKPRDSADAPERGAALIEMALVLPMLVLLLFGIWTTARAYNVKNTMDHAVREAARYGATIDPWVDAGGTTPTCSGSPSSSEEAVRCLADNELTASAIAPGDVQTVCVDMGATPCSTTATGADQVTIQLQYPGYQLNFVLFSVSVDLNASATARYES